MLPTHGAVGPVIAPGVGGGEVEVTASDTAEEVPHPFVAVTVIFPDVAAGVVVREEVVLVPVQPVGTVQV